MIARGVRRTINSRLVSDPLLQLAPARTIASILSHIFGNSSSLSGDKQSTDALGVTTTDKDDAAHLITDETSVIKDLLEQKESAPGKKKRNKHKHHPSATSTPPQINGSEPTPPALPDAAGTKEEYLTDLAAVIDARFLYKLTLADETATPGTSFLGLRISRLTLLRRICILCGIRIVTKDYGFTSLTPFTVDDIAGVSSVVKPSTGLGSGGETVPETAAMISTARRLLASGQFPSAYEVAHEASLWLHNVSIHTLHHYLYHYYSFHCFD